MRVCRVCGYTDERACVSPDGEGGTVTCSWYNDELCSFCYEEYDEAPEKPSPLLFDAYGGPAVWR